MPNIMEKIMIYLRNKKYRSSQIHLIYHVEVAWLHLTLSIGLISQDHPNYRFGRIVAD